MQKGHPIRSLDTLKSEQQQQQSSQKTLSTWFKFYIHWEVFLLSINYNQFYLNILYLTFTDTIIPYLHQANKTFEQL